MMKHLLDRAKAVLTDPVGCWAKLKKTKRKDALMYLIVLLVLSAVLSLLVTGGKMGMMAVSLALLPMLITVAVAFVLSVVSAWLVNLVLGWLGAKGSWETALKAVSYGSTPSALLGWIPFLNFVGVVWSLVVQVIGLKAMYKTTYAKAIIAVVVCALIFGAVMFVLTMLFGATLMSMMGMAGAY